jgi:hypothetical protein
MTFSLNEIEVMGKRAARGAGFSWGLAEEAGKAARWLTVHDLPGPEVLAELLTRNDGGNYDDLAPATVDGLWLARSGRLCPLVSGAALCDRASEIASGQTIELGPTAYPVLLLPYAAAAAKLTGVALELSWADVRVELSSEGMAYEGESSDLTARSADRVRCRRTEQTLTVEPAGVPGREVPADTWSRLGGFAQRTFAPATEASRLAGAGAGLRDND